MVRGTNETFVFGGNRRHRHRRELLQKRRPAYCCGSTIPNAADSEKTGSFSRFTSSGSIKITKAPPKGSLPPAPVRDLRVSALTPRGFQLAWTATGDDLDTGVVSDYELLMLYNWTSRTRAFDQVSSVNLSSHVTPHDLKTKVLVEPGTKVVVNVSLELGHYNFLAIKAIDALGIKSNDSNLVALSYAKENGSRTTAASVITPSYSSEEDIQPTDPSITSGSTNTIGNPDNTCDPRNSSNHINCPHSSKNEESANRMTAVIAILSLLGFLVILGIVYVVHYFRRRRRFDM
ncbi:calcium-activated chloride channel regulator 1-like [Penaeus japonicus]|uniref:calcium-activated chloride channel regulator 1-like n=1 Tax=Penaeus japonicus TaxID=27405 RepID=UPI001C7163A4|nr:calcium-activated chloride channel regulator 1-like [Penaeus japonicus]